MAARTGGVDGRRAARTGSAPKLVAGTLRFPAPVPERTKGTACKAVKPRVQIPPGAPVAPSPIFAFGFAELSAAPLGTTFRGADALAARCLGCPRGVGAFGGCARARRSRRSVTAGLARGLMRR